MTIEFIFLLVAIAGLFTILGFWQEGSTQFMVAGMIWLAAAAGTAVVDMPYAIPSGDNSATVEVYHPSGGEIYIAWIFVLIAVIMFLHALHYLFRKGPKP
jgi:uncharacterized membrane protein